VPVNKKIIICCGGTGGHFYPGLSVAETFNQRGACVKLFLTGKRSKNQAEIAINSNIESFILSPLPLPLGIAGKLKFLFVLLFHIFENIRILKKEKPDCMLCMGSFNTVPSALAARLLKIPVFLHDGNSFIGKANILLSNFAVKLGAAFPPVNAAKLKCPFKLLGMPLRNTIYPKFVKQKFGSAPINAINSLFNTDFSQTLPLFLIFGGSQGAKTFNTAIPKILSHFNENQFQIIHLTGKGNYDEATLAYKNITCKYKILESSSEMGLLYSAADLVISRSGGSTVAELALYGKNAVLIPFPFASEDHQTVNAQYYTSKGAAVLINEKNCNDELQNYLTKWLNNKNIYLDKCDDAKTLSFPNATDDVIEMILTHLNSIS